MTPEIYTAVMVPTELIPIMSNIDPQRPIPQTTFQLVGQAATDVTSGVAKAPIMLGVLVLNILGIVAAVYFLNLLIAGQQRHLGNLLEIQTNNMNTILQVHNREFDALMELTRTVTADKAALPAPVPPLPGPQPTTPPRR